MHSYYHHHSANLYCYEHLEGRDTTLSLAGHPQSLGQSWHTKVLNKEELIEIGTSEGNKEPSGGACE